MLQTGVTPLHAAVVKGSHAVARMLLDAGAEKEATVEVSCRFLILRLPGSLRFTL